MFLIERIFAGLSRLFPLLAFPLILTTVPALALTKEAAVENCRMSVGKPIVIACMRGGGNSFEGCREKARPQVVACVIAALNAANGRANVAVAVPTEAAPKPMPGTALPAGFVAPPRTISDIRSILDGEKPDPALIERLKTAANAVPTGKETRGELSQFYFDRSAARSQLGRLAEAITDANKAIEVGRGVIDAFTMGRNTQLLALNYFYAGDLKQSLDIYLRMLRETDVRVVVNLDRIPRARQACMAALAVIPPETPTQAQYFVDLYVNAIQRRDASPMQCEWFHRPLRVSSAVRMVRVFLITSSMGASCSAQVLTSSRAHRNKS